ncbi:hypothetical protein [Cognatilysobacter segetis]|uniref:hypothetical protein n=1 Tax=Cognatilysobacter segetis TaxID=2492394 RepID=UPI00105F31F2|nr:hypothetical protein [Lysobacter segetis]
MLHLDLCWDEHGRGIVLRHGDRQGRRGWPMRLFALGSARVDAGSLSGELMDELEMFGSAVLRAVDETTIVRRLVAH